MITWQPGVTLEQMEKMIIEKALVFYQGNKTQAAASLGIAIKTLYNKLDQYQNEKLALAAEREKEENERQAKIKHQRGPTISTPAWNGVESTSENSEELPLPLPQRQEVQSLPLKSASGSSNRKAR